MAGLTLKRLAVGVLSINESAMNHRAAVGVMTDVNPVAVEGCFWPKRET